MRDMKFSEGWLSPAVAGVLAALLFTITPATASLSLILHHLSFIAMHRMSEYGKIEQYKGETKHNENKVDSM